MKKTPDHMLVRFFGADGKPADLKYYNKPYLPRLPVGHTGHAAPRMFHRTKPRYKSVAGLLVMGRRSKRGAKGPLCPVVPFNR